MTEPILWGIDDHTRAKHRVLESYLAAWIPIMAFQSQKTQMLGEPRLLIVDGFAGPGQYEEGEPGSPLIMLDTLLEHASFDSFGAVKFLFLFIEHDERRIDHLKSRLAEYDLPENVEVAVEHGEFEETFGELVEGVQERNKVLVPTFAFIDPFGYSAASMSLSGKFLNFPRSEILMFLPLAHIVRFAEREGQEEAMTALFGTDRWKQVAGLTGERRRQFLLDLFEEQLEAQGGIEYVRSFALRTKDGNDYRLVFGTGHIKGLEAMKDAMWKVDRQEGVQYVARTDAGQEVLFESEVNTKPLLDQLRETFGTETFSIDEARETTLLKTPFRAAHLKTKTLRPAEAEGLLDVDRPVGKQKGSFPDGVKMMFRD